MQLPKLLPADGLDSWTRRILCDKIEDIIRFLLDNSSKYFVPGLYGTPATGYHKQVAQYEARTWPAS